jgi:hypothetical protein
MPAGTAYQEQQQLLLLQHPDPQQEDAPGRGMNSGPVVWAMTPWCEELRCSTNA